VSSASVPPEYAHAVIAAPLGCRRCGYDLRGLRADGQCPECGLDNWLSVVDTVDPDASRLPRLHDPRAVGNAVLVITACMMIAVIALIAPSVATQVEALAARGPGRIVPPLVWHGALLAALMAVPAMAALVGLAPPRGREPTAAVWRNIAMLALGFVAWGVIAVVRWRLDMRMTVIPPPPELAVPRTVCHLVMAGAAILALLAVRDVLAIIGTRSREYRTARGGRQRIRDMIAAVAGIAAGDLVRLFGITTDSAGMRAIGTIVSWISVFMLVVGLAYLAMNVWWIRQALRRPPPAYDELLLPPLPDDTTIAGVEEDEEEQFHVLARGEPYDPTRPPAPPGDVVQL
jgi:hypothetical protein